MRFQAGQSGNPAGRPPGSLNKRTLAAQAVLAERAEEIVTNLMDRAMEGQGTAMRLCADRLLPTGRNRCVAIELPMVQTPDDAEAALAVVLAELAAGKLTVSEVSAFITVIQRMSRLAEWLSKWRQAEGEAEAAAAVASSAPDAAAPQQRAPDASQSGATTGAPLYSPVNSAVAGRGEGIGVLSREKASSGGPDGWQDDKAPPLPRAA